MRKKTYYGSTPSAFRLCLDKHFISHRPTYSDPLPLSSGAAPDGNPVDGPYPTEVRQPSGRTVLVVQAYQYGKYLGQLNVTFDDAGEVKSWSGKPLVLDGEKDAEAERKLKSYKEQVRGN